jgi:predicted PurR-regulated permease PerM
VARIISVGKDNLPKFLLRKFNSLDFFTRLFIITVILLVIATPFIVYNYQLFNVHGETQAQRLQSIQQMQKSQNNLQNSFAKSSTASNPSIESVDAATPSNPAKGFNLLDAIASIFTRITQIFK